MGRVEHKVVLISGGAQGMGAAQAEVLVSEGARVVIGDVLDDAGRAVAETLGGSCPPPAAPRGFHQLARESTPARRSARPL
jgi:NAD(P)-dependent dehydrogenase (short-subunit alcohol dehydrogenase family)